MRHRPNQACIAFQVRMWMIRAIYSFCALLALFSLTTIQAATIKFSGGTTPETIPLFWGADNPAVVGVFADGFDLFHPFRPGDICQYGDEWCNLESDYYFQMVASHGFIPLGEVSSFGSGTFMGTAVATGIEGRQLWVILWDTPDKLGFSVITSALGNPNWLGASDLPGSDSNQIDLADVNTVIFGELQDGRIGPFHGLPIPEPSTWTLFFGGLLVVAWRVSRTRPLQHLTSFARD